MLECELPKPFPSFVFMLDGYLCLNSTFQCRVELLTTEAKADPLKQYGEDAKDRELEKHGQDIMPFDENTEGSKAIWSSQHYLHS